ncbi:MAG TPA: S9 family peptidase [Calditrichae bacterium]|nr:S9 family peptidase [Calditrichia bacterium]
MRRLLVFWVIFLVAALIAGEKAPFSIDALYKVKSVSSPAISPDGKRIAFRVTTFYLKEGKSNADIYVMNLDGRNLRRMTTSEDADFAPAWSPDGKYLYFISTRSGDSQVWRIPVDGGEAEQLTDFPMGVEDFVLAPNGKWLAFSTKVFPECGADGDCNDALQTDMEEGTVQAHLADRLFYRHWNFWKDGKRTHTLLFDIEKKTYTDLTPGDYDAPSFSLGGMRGFAFAPDAREMCYVSNHDSNEWETTNKDLWLVPTSGGEARNITDENEAYDGEPLYSPNGRYIAYKMQKIPTYESDRFRLAIYDRKTGKKTVLTEDFDYWVDDFAWAPNSRYIYFTAEVKGHIPLYRVDIRSKKIRKILDVKTIDAFDISPDGKWVVFSRRSVGEPQEIWRATTSGKRLQRLPFFNKALEDSVDIRPAEEMWIPSPTGRKIHTFIVKPHNFDPNKKYPLILNVHGGPQGMWADAFRGDWQVYPGAGYIVAFPNPHGSTGYGQDFTAEISGDWGGKVYQDVMAVADSLAKLPYVDENRMGAMGWSYGGYMMMWLEGHTTRFKAIAAMMGVYDLPAMYGATEELWFPQWDLKGTPWTSDLYQKWSPHNYAANFKTPCLVITGELDFRVPYTQSLEFFTALQKLGVPSRLIVFKYDGHWPSYIRSMPVYYNAHLEWFHKYLGGDPAPYDTKEMIRNRAFKK